MKWVLAALSFALLVALAIGTVALKATNVRARARIEKLSREVESCRMEVARLALQQGQTTERLASLWRRVLEWSAADTR